MVSVGEKAGKAVSAFAARRIRRRHGNGSSTGLGDTHQPAARGRGEENHASRAPRPAAAIRGVAQRLDVFSRHVDLLELAAAEEGDEAAVRRPERQRRLVGTGQRSLPSGIVGPIPEDMLAFEDSMRQ